jgi:tRNA-specific 2-thiouridylase
MDVFQPALDVYATGETPNPDIACNREIKFGKLFDKLKARHQGQNWWLATGTYQVCRWCSW